MVLVMRTATIAFWWVSGQVWRCWSRKLLMLDILMLDLVNTCMEVCSVVRTGLQMSDP